MLGKLTAALVVGIAGVMVFYGDGSSTPQQEIVATVLDRSVAPVIEVAVPAKLPPKVPMVASTGTPPPQVEPETRVEPAPTPVIAARRPAAVTPDRLVSEASAPVTPVPETRVPETLVPAAFESAEIPAIRPVPRPELRNVVATSAPTTPDAVASVSDPIVPAMAPVDRPRLDPATTLYVQGDGVNLRDGPSEYDRIVMQLAQGDTARLIADPGTGWMLVKTVETGRQGFIASALLSTQPPGD